MLIFTRTVSPIRAGLCLLACLIATGPSDVSATEPVLLRYKFQPGQIVRFEVDLRDDYTIQVQQVKEDQHSYQVSQKSYHVLSAHPDGSAVIQLVPMDQINVDILQNGETFRFNSQEKVPQVNPIFAAMERMVGRPNIEATVSATGEVSRVKSLLSPDTKPEEIDRNALDVFIRLPEEPQSVGSTWFEKFEVGVKLTNSMLTRMIKIQRAYRLESVVNNLATIEMKTQILTPMNDPDEEVQLIRRAAEGRFVLDLSRGVVISQSISQDREVTGFGETQSVMRFKQRHEEKLLRIDVAQGPAMMR
ncbi:hypothetical protein [Planctomicrobium sp. SH664]|uniref:hypothetical protein n=1 Tax=Planctomicrobium sp. SH664 TaxID=3448125 RepID=UPI003F5C54A0